jgi:hypothetical protein
MLYKTFYLKLKWQIQPCQNFWQTKIVIHGWWFEEWHAAIVLEAIHQFSLTLHSELHYVIPGGPYNLKVMNLHPVRIMRQWNQNYISNPMHYECPGTSTASSGRQQTELQLNSTDREDGFCPSKSWKPPIYHLKEHMKTPLKSSLLLWSLSWATRIQ